MEDTEKQIDPGSQPFTTTDAELALSLLTAGCQWAEAKEGGPCQMHFSPEICRNRWVTKKDPSTGHPIRVPLLSHYPQSPEQFEVAVIRAVRLRIPGVVTYYIARDQVFREAMAMHDKLADEALCAAREGRPMVIPALHTLTEASQVMVVCYIRRRNKEDMEAHGWIRPPNLALGDVRKTLTPKEGASKDTLEQMSYTANGSGRIWSLNLSDEKRATLMSDGKPFIHPKPKQA